MKGRDGVLDLDLSVEGDSRVVVGPDVRGIEVDRPAEGSDGLVDL